MSLGIEYWKSQLEALPPRDRAELAYYLLSSFEPEEKDSEALWDAEASVRVTEIRADQASGRPIDDFLKELQERFP
jgi:putative addiction module component (TIGR02574 family)